MRGSKFPDGVTVDHTALRRTETSKAQEILRNRLSWTSRGVLSGGVVSVNTFGAAPHTHIDVTQLTGFAPNGEYIETDSAYFDLALASETLNVVNYVCAIYAESNTHRQPHETDGETYPIFAEMSWRIRVYTEAAFNALPTTDDNLANDAQDRALVLALVTANGPAASLTASSIQSPMDFNNILYSTPRSLATITGVDILSISPDTPVGAGTLSYTYVAPNTYTFTWTTSNGAGVTPPISADSTINIVDGAGEYIRCFIAVSLLPIVGPFPLVETVTITNLYYQQLPRLSAEDNLHRNYIGTGTITPENPHGSSLDDITGESFSLLNEHQDVMHCNGIWRGSAANVLSVSINEATSPDQFDVTAPVGADLYYVNGKKINTIIDGAGVSIPTAGLDQTAHLYEIYVTDETAITYTKKASYPLARTVTGTWIVDMSPNYPAGFGTLAVVTVPAVSWTFTWAGGKPYVFYAGAPSQAIRLYADDGAHWIDLWVNVAGGSPDATLPVISTSDAIGITASSSDGDNGFMRIASVVYWYEPIGPSWHLGYPPLAASRFAVDNRHWGTLCAANMGDSALQDLIYSPNNELGRSGVVLRRNGVYNEFQYTHTSPSLSVDISGGAYYARGKRVVADTVQTLVLAPNNLSQLIWADMDGVYHALDVTGTFAGDVQAAMRYVLGFTQDVPAVSDAYHYRDHNDAPERGVLLYAVATDATDIINIVDLMQNVNHVTDPWSVGSRISTNADTHVQAAYDSLFTAFEYAKYSMYSTAVYKEDRGAVTINLIGTAEVDFAIVQPEYVNVRGTHGSTAPSQCLVRSNVNNRPAWSLSTGCQVSGIGILNLNVLWPVLGPADFSIIRDCYCVSSGGAFMTWMTLGATQVSGVVVENNITYGSAFINGLTPATNGLLGWVITGNKVYSVPVGILTVAVLLYNTEKLIFADNFIEIPDSLDTPTAAVSIGTWLGTQSRDVVLRNNNIRIGSSAAAPQVNSPVGIYLDDVWFASVEGNVIEATAGAISQASTGVAVVDMINSSIMDNKFNILGGGVAMLGSCYDVDISRNKFAGMFHNGIWVSITNFPLLSSAYGLKIENNDMYVFGKGTLGGVYNTNELAGVVVESDLDGGPSNLANVSISNNLMSGFLSASYIRGIRLEVDASNFAASAREFKINGNLIYGLLSSGGSTRGIYVLGNSGSAPVTGMTGVSINDNQVLFSADSVASRIAGIDVATTVVDATVNDNVVVLYSANPASYGAALYMGATVGPQTPHNYVVSGNILLGLRGGVYARCGFTGGHSLISDNLVYAKGTGIYLYDCERDRTVLDNNNVHVAALNGNFWDGTDTGSHCIVCENDQDGVMLSNNALYLAGDAVLDVPAASSCISLRDIQYVQIDGGRLASNAITVNTTDGSASPDFGYLCYLRARANALPSHFLVKGVTFDDRPTESGATRTPLNGLYITPGAGWAHLNGDALHAHIGNNTFITSNDHVGGALFNAEGNAAPSAALPANFPYAIYVALSFGWISGTTASELYFVGNSIFTPASILAIPYVYLPLYGATAWGAGREGWCFYAAASLQNFCTQNGINGATDKEWL